VRVRQTVAGAGATAGSPAHYAVHLRVCFFSCPLPTALASAPTAGVGSRRRSRRDCLLVSSTSLALTPAVLNSEACEPGYGGRDIAKVLARLSCTG
jgi:hypothetical protein